MPGDRKLVNTSQAARALNVHPSTLWRWQQKGQITPAWTTPGRQARWDLDELRRQLKISGGDEFVPDKATTPESSPVVASVVVSERGVLIGKRRDGKPPWTFIAGEIEPGESPADAAVREVKEETGLLVRTAEQEIGRRVHPKTGRTMVYLACYPIDKLDVFVGDVEELDEVAWVNLEELQERMSNIFEPVLEHLRQELS